MKGIVLAGGLGTRMGVVTERLCNKHAILVYDKPMIYYPLQTLKDAGIDEVCLVSGGRFCGDFIQLLRNGEEFGFKSITYKFQHGETGIAAALALAEAFAAGEPVVVILGDNIFLGQEEINLHIKDYKGNGAKVLLKKVPDPQRFGVADFPESTLILGTPRRPRPYQFRVLRRIIEKPVLPPSNLAVTGLYIYDSLVFDIIKTLKPSERGELEVTDLNNHYIEIGRMDWSEYHGEWLDAGTPDSLLRAANKVAEKHN